MNIGQLFRAVLGDVAPGDPKALELKIGQVVKGLVLKLLSEQDALVNIGGTVVRARLEVPLQQGKVTFLQVQPESATGPIVLKPLSESEVPLPGDGAGLLLRSLGLPDRPDERQSAQLLHLEGATLSRDNVESLAKVLQAKPTAVAAEEWKTAALLAMKKSLPLTPETVASLRAAIFEPPVHQAAAGLAGQLARLLQSGALPQGSGAARAAHQLVADVEALRGQSAALLGTDLEEGGSASTSPAASRAMEARGIAVRNVRPPAVPEPNTLVSPPSTAAPPESVRGSAVGDPYSPPRLVPGGPETPAASVRGSSADSPVSPIAAGPAPNTPAASGESAGNPKAVSPGGTAETGWEPLASVPLSDPNTKNSGGDMAMDDSRAKGEPDDGQGQAGGLLKGLLKLFGTDHEANWSRLLQEGPTPQSSEPASDKTSSSLPAPSDSSTSLKGALLQLVAASDDLPQPVKDAAQQLLQQVTGAQLLLAPDRSVPIAQITMTLPLMQANGEQTAAIHIQARAGKRGELDAANCRLMFDLQMKTLGLTLVDVRVVDRKVGLEVRNDMEPARAWFDRSRDEIASALSSAGYQLVSLKSLPFPEAAGYPGEARGEPHDEQASMSRIASRYKTKPYKGMDIRV